MIKFLTSSLSHLHGSLQCTRALQDCILMLHCESEQYECEEREKVKKGRKHALLEFVGHFCCGLSNSYLKLGIW